MSAGIYHSPRFNWLVRNWPWTFVLMGLGFVAFGVASLNLVQLFSANANFLLEHGWQAIVDGGLLQLFQLIATTYLAISFYLLFKTCEHALIERLAHFDSAVHDAAKPESSDKEKHS